MKNFLLIAILLITFNGLSQNFQVQGNHTVCYGDSTIISISLINDTIFQIDTFSYNGGPISILDDSDGISGNGITIPSIVPITVSGYLMSDTISSLSDISNICIDFEHSYAGDLNIKLVSPNGSFVYLIEMNPPNPPNSDFGFPDVSSPQPGTPSTYCWSPTALLAPITPSSTFGVQIPPGVYQATGDWNALIGSPKNGNWQVQFADDFSGDNGFVFQVNISFLNTFVISDTIGNWKNNVNIISPIIDTNEILFYSPIDGLFPLEYYVLRDNGDTISYYDTIMVISPSLSYDTLHLCFGDSFILPNGSILNNNLTFLDTIICDSVISKTISFSPSPSFVEIDTFLCNGDFYYFLDGSITDTSGVFYDTLLNEYSCNSVLYQINVTAVENAVHLVNSCVGDSITYYGETYFPVNSFSLITGVLLSSLGCDSIPYTLLVYLKSNYTDTTSIQLYNGQTFVMNNGSVVSSPGQYIDSFQTVYGCDSIFVYNVDLVGVNYSDTMYYEFCENSGILINSSYYNSPGLYQDTIVGASSDSIFIFELTELNVSYSTDVLTFCDSYTWINGSTYTTSNNTANYTLTNSVGCDSIVTLNLTILNSSTITDVQTEPSPYLWIDGNTYFTDNNTATYTLMNSVGCDSIITLNLTIIDTVIQGNITTSNSAPLQNSKVFLIEYFSATDSVFALDSTTTDVGGFYQFTNVFQNAYIKAVPELGTYLNEVPTYNISSSVFQNADDVSLTSLVTVVDFSTIAGLNPGGNGFIGGIVGNGAGKNNEVGEPISGLSLVLMNSNSVVVEQTNTNINGEFSFDNLAEETFSLWVDKAGVLNNLSPSISLVEDNSQDDLRFILHKTYLENITTVGINSIEESNFSIFPNPTNDKIIIRSFGKSYSFEIISILGESIYSNTATSNNTSIDFNKMGLNKGTYFIKISTEHNSFVYKIVYQ